MLANASGMFLACFGPFRLIVLVEIDNAPIPGYWFKAPIRAGHWHTDFDSFHFVQVRGIRFYKVNNQIAKCFKFKLFVSEFRASADAQGAK